MDQNATYLADEAEYWRKMDALFADAESLQVQLIPSLNWCLFLWPDLAGDSLHEMVANPHSASSAMLQKYVTTFVTRYTNSSAVFAWELVSCHDIAATWVAFFSRYRSWLTGQRVQSAGGSGLLRRLLQR